jgi:AraC family transcriptional regulator
MTPLPVGPPTQHRRLSQGHGLRLTLIDYAPGWSMPAHHHETFGVSVVLRGHVEECVGRTTVQTGTGGLVVKPSGTVHANRFGPSGARLLSLDIHPAGAEDVLCHPEAFGPWRWLRSTAALRVAVHSLRPGSLEAETEGSLAAAAMLELCDLLIQDEGRVVEPRSPAWLLAVRDRIHAEHVSPCRVRDLARAAGVHPVHLARRFRARFGCTVTEYLRQVRLSAAAAALADGERSVGAVAAATGFADQSHLCRVFRAAVGVPPSGYRSLAQAG